MHAYFVVRQSYKKEIVRIKNRIKQSHSKLMIKLAEKHLAFIEKNIAVIDAELEALIQKDEALKTRYEILLSIVGIGKVAAMAMLIEMPELGSMNKKQVAALAGLAPMTRQSGNWRGKAFIQGGRKLVRDALFMPAMVTSRYNKDMKEKYDRLMTKGKPHKVAVVAIMRSLIVTANALLRDGRKFA